MNLLKHFISTLLISILPLTSNADEMMSIEDNNINPIIIATYEEDVTGDGLKEIIELKGHLLSEDGQYYRDVWAEISNEHGDQWKIHYRPGYNPRLQFLNLTNNDLNDIYYQVANTPNKASYDYDLHTLTSFDPVAIRLPKQNYLSGVYKDEFIIEITLDPNEKPIHIDISNQANRYINEGIYDKSGRLLQSASAHIEDILLFEPVFYSESKGYALKSYQHIRDTLDKDEIGTIETLWYYENDTWTILNTECIVHTS